MAINYTISLNTQRIEGTKILVEIQIRTLAMNFATIEHSLNYNAKGIDTIHEQERAAEAAFLLLIEEMSQIREEIQRSAIYFCDNKENQRKRKKRRDHDRFIWKPTEKQEVMNAFKIRRVF